jgi:hypothetical protein
MGLSVARHFMRQFLLLLTLTTIFGGLCASSQNVNFKPLFSAGLDTTQGRLLLKQCSRATPKNISSFWSISSDNIDVLESNFETIYSLTSKKCCWTDGTVDSLKNFGFQYVGVVIGGQRFIYVNAFPLDVLETVKHFRSKFDPTKTPIIVCDGGASFWGGLFNIETQTFSSLSFNGPG